MTQCINCGGGEFKNFFVEHIPCAHCNEINEVEYRICTSCGMVAKFVGDELISGAVFSDEDTQQLFETDVDELVEMFEKAASMVEEEVMYPAASMSDLIHKCIRCGTRSFEKEKGLWHCPDCGFEWEVIPGV